MGKANDDSASKRILILDDNPSLVNVFAKMLSSQGFLVTTETSLKNGLRKISHNTFDGVFVDIPINNYDENDVLTLFYENRIFTKSNILLLSSVDITKLSKWKEYGLYSYIKKPVKRDMLLHMLEHLPSTPSIPSTVKNNDLSSLASGEIIKSEQLQTQIHELESRPSEPTPSPRGSLPLISKEVPQEIPSEHDEATHEQLARLEQLQTHLREYKLPPLERTKKKVLILQPRDSRLEHVLSGLLSVKSQFRPLTHNMTSLGEESKILVKTEIDQLLSEVSHLKNEVHSLNDISK
ncbi:MAG: response regulator [Nitrosarchaeum sp.]|nr:response regulator [Nitrosarchaeum sp.]